jgi:hypothetical protein
MVKHWAIWTAVAMGMAMPAVALGEDLGRYPDSSMASPELVLRRMIGKFNRHTPLTGRSSQASAQATRCDWKDQVKELGKPGSGQRAVSESRSGSVGVAF